MGRRASTGRKAFSLLTLTNLHLPLRRRCAQKFEQNHCSRMRKIHFRSTCVARARLCLCSLIYQTSDSDLSLVRRFLKRCHKWHFISYPVDIFSLLEKQDRSVLSKSISIDVHPLTWIIPERKETKYKLRKVGCLSPKIDTQRFKTTDDQTQPFEMTTGFKPSQFNVCK